MEIDHHDDFVRWATRLGPEDAKRVARSLQRLGVLGLDLLGTSLVKRITGATGLYELRPTGDLESSVLYDRTWHGNVLDIWNPRYAGSRYSTCTGASSMSSNGRIKHTEAMDLLLRDPVARAAFDVEAARYELLDRIISARKSRGWSQADLARVLGWKRPAISRLEAGETDPRWSTVAAVLDALGLPVAVGGHDLQRVAG